jgi:hypothetical protein
MIIDITGRGSGKLKRTADFNDEHGPANKKFILITHMGCHQQQVRSTRYTDLIHKPPIFISSTQCNFTQNTFYLLFPGNNNMLEMY